jgi:hypothetical protein
VRPLIDRKANAFKIPARKNGILTSGEGGLPSSGSTITTHGAGSYSALRWHSTTMKSVHVFASSDFSPHQVKCVSEIFV